MKKNGCAIAALVLALIASVFWGGTIRYIYYGYTVDPIVWWAIVPAALCVTSSIMSINKYSVVACTLYTIGAVVAIISRVGALWVLIGTIIIWCGYHFAKQHPASAQLNTAQQPARPAHPVDLMSIHSSDRLSKEDKLKIIHHLSYLDVCTAMKELAAMDISKDDKFIIEIAYKKRVAKQ